MCLCIFLMVSVHVATSIDRDPLLRCRAGAELLSASASAAAAAARAAAAAAAAAGDGLRRALPELPWAELDGAVAGAAAGLPGLAALAGAPAARTWALSHTSQPLPLPVPSGTLRFLALGPVSFELLFVSDRKYIRRRAQLRLRVRDCFRVARVWAEAGVQGQLAAGEEGRPAHACTAAAEDECTCGLRSVGRLMRSGLALTQARARRARCVRFALRRVASGRAAAETRTGQPPSPVPPGLPPTDRPWPAPAARDAPPRGLLRLSARSPGSACPSACVCPACSAAEPARHRRRWTPGCAERVQG